MEDPEVEATRSNAIAPATYFQAYAGRRRTLLLREGAGRSPRRGAPQTFTPFKVPNEGDRFAGSTRPSAACFRTISSSATARSPTTIRIRRPHGTRNPRGHLRHTWARTKTRCKNTPIFEENGPDNFKGIDIMRAVRSFDPCLPCGVHMYLGKWAGRSSNSTPQPP